ncbi:ferroptosis suppressor protein 1-like [Ptychodera flava]|uniref:ferroptosis suppressor protein 1-like n=1 Tax=Ptychodera flava TaxID=63121 RepID=UPI00396A15F2
MFSGRSSPAVLGSRQISRHRLLAYTVQNRTETKKDSTAYLRMGSGSSSSLAAESHVVIIGGGFGGTHVAKKLKGKNKFTLIDGKECLQHNISALRGAVQPGFASASFIPYSDLVGDNFKRGTVTAIDQSAKTVTLEDSSTINYTTLVIATGTRAPFPGQVPANSDKSDAVSMYDKIIEEIKSSKKIVIIGGGAVGVELAGEIATDYKDKEVTLIHPRDVLVDADIIQKAQKLMKDQLTKLGVNLVLGERVSNLSELPREHTAEMFKVLTDKGTEIEADLVLFCTGAKVNSSAYENSLADKMNERGQLKVTEFLQVEGCEDIYAIGDCNDVKETKMAYRAEQQADLLVSNLVNEANGKAKKPYKPKGVMMVVSLGRNGGIFQFGTSVFGPFMTKKIKSGDLFVKKFYKDWGLKMQKT